MTNRQSRCSFLAAASSAAALGGALAAKQAKTKRKPFVLNYNRHDELIWQEELEDFVPQKVFDAHNHVLNKDHLDPDDPKTDARTHVDLATLQAYAKKLYHGREVHFLLLGNPVPGIDVQAHVNWYSKEARQDPNSRAFRLVTPSCKLEDIERDVKNLGFTGFKVYRCFSVTGDIDQCRIHEYLPHEQLELANDLGLWVTLHLARSDGGGDKQNLDDLQEYTMKRYPKIKWILAHCARSFTYYPIRQGIDRLRDMPNIWYDLSAVCDPLVFVTLFGKEDKKRLFHGSDSIDAVHFRGRYIVLGRAWQYLDADKTDLTFAHCDYRPILCAYEQFLAMKEAAEIVGLSKSEIQDIFWGNAAREFGLDDA